MLSADFFIPMRRLGNFFYVAMNGMAASDKMFAILDEPTSNLDSLNEAVILKVLRGKGHIGSGLGLPCGIFCFRR